MPETVLKALQKYDTVIVPFKIVYPKVHEMAMRNIYAQMGGGSDSTRAAWAETSKSAFLYKARQRIKIAPDRCIVGLLTDLAEQGKRVVITTTLPPALIEAAIELLAPAGDNTLLRELTGSGSKVFSSTYCNGSDSPLAHILDSLQASPYQTAMIVNNPSDIKSVQADCLAPIVYTGGKSDLSPADLQKAGAVAVFEGCGKMTPN